MPTLAARTAAPDRPGGDGLLLSLGLVAAPVQYGKESNAFHQTGSRVAKESTPGLERSVDSDVVIGRHVEVARLGRVM